MIEVWNQPRFLGWWDVCLFWLVDFCQIKFVWNKFVTTHWLLWYSVSTGASPITSISWLSMHNLLVSLTKEGTVSVWRTRGNLDPNKSLMRANFLESAGNFLIYACFAMVLCMSCYWSSHKCGNMHFLHNLVMSWYNTNNLWQYAHFKKSSVVMKVTFSWEELGHVDGI